MPFTSTQISGLVGGQQVMFSNQAAFANQISDGGSQQMMANPYPSPSYGVAGLDSGSPDIGAKMAGGVALALPAMAAGAGMAASLIGYKSSLGLLDPFTGISRAFGAGTGGGMAARAGVMAGAEGMGLKYAMGNISGAFAQGGLRAGLGAVGGGLAGAAVAAVPYYVAGKALEYTAGRMYEGVQNVQDVRRMSSQYFDPQYGRQGARPGGGMNMGMASQVTDVLRDIVDQDVQQSMSSMRKVMDRAGQMGMLQGIGDPQQFKDKFKKVVASAKAVATMLGSTLEDALPFVNQMNSMGIWRASDVMGAAAEARGLGKAGGQAMMGSMAMGAQMSHAMGGSMAAGAVTGRNLFGQVAAGMRLGTFSEEQLKDYTGGVGGAEGQRIMAGGIQRVVAGMGETALGRLTMAGLGEVKDGKYTGRMDEGLMSKFQRGDVSIAQLQGMGQKNMQNKELATSFFNRAPQLGQAMGAQGGLDLFQAGLKKAMAKAFGTDRASELEGSEIENRMIQLLSGADQRNADVVQKALQDLPRMKAERQRLAIATMEDSFREAEIKKNRSFSGLSAAIGKSIDRATQPFEKLGQNLAVGMSEQTTRLSDWISGRVQASPRIEESEMMRMRLAGDLKNAPSLKDLGISNVGQNFMDPGVFGNLVQEMGRPEGMMRRVGGGALMGAGAGALVGSVAPGVGTVAGGIVGGIGGGLAGAMGFDPIRAMGANMQAGGLDMSGREVSELLPRARSFLEAGLQAQRGEVGEGDVSLGGGLKARSQDLQITARRAVMRAQNATIENLLGGENEEKRRAMDVVGAKMRKVLTDPSLSNELRELKENRPEEYARKLMEKVKEGDPSVAGAMRSLGKGHPMGEGSEGADLDIAAITLKEAGAEGGDFGVDFNRVAENLGGIALGTTAELSQRQNDLFDQMSSSSGAFGGVGAAVGAGAATGAIAGAAFFGVGAVAGAAIGAGIGLVVGGLSHLTTRDMSAQDFRSALSSDKYSNKDVLAYLRGDSSGSNKFALAALKDPAAAKLRKHIDEKRKSGDTKGLEEMIGSSGELLKGQARNQETARYGEIAGRAGPVGDIKGVSAGVESQLESARKLMEGGDALGGIAALGKVEVSDVELHALREGGGGVMGQQLALQKDISGMGEMSSKELMQFRKKLSKGFGGRDLISAVQGTLSGDERKQFEKMLEGGIQGSAEVNKLKGMLQDVAPQAFGAGAKADPMLDAYSKFTDAAGKFSDAVTKLVGDGDGKQDAATDNPTANVSKFRR